jgi:N4-gp56 family major capsid protein
MSLTLASTYSAAVTADSRMKAIAWAEKVRKGSSQDSVFRDFTGEEGSSNPVIKKRDIEKGMAEEVVFTSTVPVRGQGKLGENELKGATQPLGFSTFKVNVDLLRQAVAYTQLFGLVRFKKRTPMQISSDLMKEWWGRKNDDDIMITLRNRALLVSPTVNLLRINNRASRAAILSSDVISTTAVDRSKGRLKANGAKPLGMEKGHMGAKSPQYLAFGTSSMLNPLQTNSTYLNARQHAEIRSPMHSLFTGTYEKWNGNIFFNHNIEIDDANGRQGSPMQPIAFLGTAIADGTPTTLTGGGTAYPAGSQDYFSYFPGFGWKTFDSEVLPTDTTEYYLCVYNITTDQKYEIIMYTPSDVDAAGHQIATVTRGSTTQTGGTNGGGNVTAQAAGRFSLAHPSGSIIFPCNRAGVPIGWYLHMGSDSCYHAMGSVDAEPIFHWDDFKNANDEAHLTGIGIQGVRGFATPTDKLSRAKNFVLVEGACDLSDFGVSMEPVLA